MPDRTLDDFLGGVDGDAPDESEEGRSDGSTPGERADGSHAADSDRSTEPAVAPATPTCRWAPDGTCDRCGTRARWRWVADGDAVCGDCKEW